MQGCRQRYSRKYPLYEKAWKQSPRHPNRMQKQKCKRMMQEKRRDSTSESSAIADDLPKIRIQNIRQNPTYGKGHGRLFFKKCGSGAREDAHGFRHSSLHKSVIVGEKTSYSESDLRFKTVLLTLLSELDKAENPIQREQINIQLKNVIARLQGLSVPVGLQGL